MQIESITLFFRWHPCLLDLDMNLFSLCTDRLHNRTCDITTLFGPMGFRPVYHESPNYDPLQPRLRAHGKHRRLFALEASATAVGRLDSLRLYRSPQLLSPCRVLKYSLKIHLGEEVRRTIQIIKSGRESCHVIPRMRECRSRGDHLASDQWDWSNRCVVRLCGWFLRRPRHGISGTISRIETPPSHLHIKQQQQLLSLSLSLSRCCFSYD